MASFPPPDSENLDSREISSRLHVEMWPRPELNKCQRQNLKPGFSEAKAHAFNQKALELPQPVVLVHDPFQKWKEHAG